MSRVRDISLNSNMSLFGQPAQLVTLVSYK
jgi:hypothetical protein